MFEGVLFDTYQWEQELYDGSKKVFERLVGQDIAKAIAVTEDGRILLIEDEQPAREKIIKFPGGYIDLGETPEVAAKRELLEETGYEAGSSEELIEARSWNKIDLNRYYFLFKGCKKVAEPLVQAGERIKVNLISFEQMLDLAADGTIDDVAIQVLALQAKLDPQKMEALKQKFFN